MATDLKKINELPSKTTLEANNFFVVSDAAGSCSKIKSNDLKLPQASLANAISPTLKTFDGTTMADLKAKLLSIINADGNYSLSSFRMSVSYEAFKHFDDDSYVIPTNNKYNVNWNVMAHNSAASFDYIQLMAVTTASGFNVYIITSSRTNSNNSNTWTCRMLSTTEP